jgi:hypothetical protein
MIGSGDNNMRPKATSMIKMGLFFLAVNLIAAGIFGMLHDRPRTIMFLLGSAFWIVGIFIWGKTDQMEQNNKG